MFHRIDRREAMLLMANIVKAKYKNRHHFSKEALVALHTSQVVVQGSPLLVRTVPKIYQSIFMFNSYWQELFHSTTYWLKASGIIDKFVDDLMNADPYIPLPKENDNKPLVMTQLMMLWIIWGSGLTAGLFAFVGEHVARKIA